MTASTRGPGRPARRDPAAPAAPPGRLDLSDWEPDAPTEAEMAEQEAILAEELAVRTLEPPEDELAGLWAPPDSGPPGGADAWLADLPIPVLEAILDARAAAAGPEPEGPFPAGVAAHDGTGPGGAGFESGSVLDRLGPGPVLARALDDAWQAGLGTRSDDELAGIMLAWRRCESRAVAGLLAATAELHRRRADHGDWRVLEHTDSEVALLLTRTRRSAGVLLGFADSLARLPATRAALAAGQIDRERADVIAYETALLDDELAVAVEQLVIEDAERLTTSGLRARLRRAVIAADPAAARRRAEKAVRDARVELYDERSGGTAALSGRDLPVPAALAADQRIDHAARELKASGIAATLAQLRAAVFLGLLTGQDPRTFLPASDDATPQTVGSSQPSASKDQQFGSSEESARGEQPGSGEQAGNGEQRGNGGVGGFSADAGQQDGHPAASASKDADPRQRDDQPREPDGQDPVTQNPGGIPALAARPGLRGSVHLTVPLTAWLGLTQSPGEVAAFGPLTAETCRELADQIAANPGSRWCLTLTDKDGHAVGHGCARRPPPPVTDLAAVAAWLSRLKTGPIQAGDCSHAREVPGYRIPESLQHILNIRQKTCSSPICGRPAARCDGDHTIPHDKGGRTCECGASPVCRTEHQAKQTPGWKLTQPSPGVLIWQPPHGRRYTVTPGVYPT